LTRIGPDAEGGMGGAAYIIPKSRRARQKVE